MHGGDEMQVGVIGLGNIGGHVAANLVADGHEVVGVRRRPRRVRGRSRAPRRRRSVADVGTASEVTVLSLPTPAVVRAVADEWVDDRRGGLDPRRPLDEQPRGRARARARASTTTGHHLVEAPLTGGAIGAENRMLSFMVGGDDDAVARVQPVLEPLGRAFVHLGPLGPRQHDEAREQPASRSPPRG